MTYVALIRGIGPSDPNMRPEKLKAFFEGLGFRHVHTVIGSGNVVFESPAASAPALEKKIEKALPKKLGFTRAVIVRSKLELEKLVKKNPYKGIRDEKPNYLLVTFFKDRRPEKCHVINLSHGHTPDFMRDLEKEHGKALTSRTWKTVHRILQKMNT